MNKCFALALFATTISLNAQVRTIYGSRVSIAPLIDWWERASPILSDASEKNRTNRDEILRSRPLKAWVSVKGKVMEESPFGWHVNAQISIQPGKTVQREILIIHPPIDEKHRFDALTNRLAFLTKVNQSASLAAWSNGETAREYGSGSSTLSIVGNSSPFLQYQVAPQQQAYSMEAERARRRSDVFQQRSFEASAQITQVRQELRMIPNDGECYILELFVLATGQKFHDLDVFDAGLPLGH